MCSAFPANDVYSVYFVVFPQKHSQWPKAQATLCQIQIAQFGGKHTLARHLAFTLTSARAEMLTRM